MRPGPAPTPGRLTVLKGNPGQRKIPAEPVFPFLAAPPEPPPFLSSYALEEWQRVVPELCAAGVLCAVDAMPLAAYCIAVDRWRRALAAGGGEPGSPLARVTREAARDVLKFASEFGLTPASRPRVRVGAGAPPRKFSEFVS